MPLSPELSMLDKNLSLLTLPLVLPLWVDMMISIKFMLSVKNMTSGSISMDVGELPQSSPKKLNIKCLDVI
jgi:hypothetical protein